MHASYDVWRTASPYDGEPDFPAIIDEARYEMLDAREYCKSCRQHRSCEGEFLCDDRRLHRIISGLLIVIDSIDWEAQ